MKTVWLVDDDASIRFVLEKALTRAGFTVQSFAEAQSVLNALKFSQPSVLISDVRMPGMDGMALLELIAEQVPGLPVIIITAHSDLDSAVNAFQKGAFEYLAKPFDLNEAIALVESAYRANSTKKVKRKLTPPKSAHIIGEAPAMQEVFRAIGKLAASSMSVLINGESGTGKELVASALHNHSPRKENQFIALNMAAIPKELVESELFGHEKGAFTGADSVRKGRFEQANGGTLFLDEIGDMPLDVQTRLLRVLSDGEFYRVGGHKSIKVDVRIIAATHQNLEELVKQGKFRDDLFHRLNVVRLRLPALRERTEDIERLEGGMQEWRKFRSGQLRYTCDLSISREKLSLLRRCCDEKAENAERGRQRRLAAKVRASVMPSSFAPLGRQTARMRPPPLRNAPSQNNAK